MVESNVYENSLAPIKGKNNLHLYQKKHDGRILPVPRLFFHVLHICLRDSYCILDFLTQISLMATMVGPGVDRYR
jgi:hypothetical protein